MQFTYEQFVEKLKHDLAADAMMQYHLPSWVHLAWFLALILVVLFLISCSVFTVHTKRFKIIERFGKFHYVAHAGLHFKMPYIDRIVANFSLNIEQVTCKVETITKDKVSVTLVVPVQLSVADGHEADAYYKLDDQYERVEAVVFDAVRSEVPKLTLDELFGSKNELAKSVCAELATDMNPFGFDISRVMITEVNPDANVKTAMNEINAAQKQGEAELAKAHNEQLVQVARAKGRLEAADLDRQAEIIDAQAVAQSVEIIGKTLHENEGYLRWKWIHMMEDTDNATIYVPTEAGLPILEAGKRTNQPRIEKS